MTRVRRIFEALISMHTEERLRCWASANAYTLIFITFMFGLTWVFILVDIFLGVTK